MNFEKNNETPLHVAARYGHVEAVEQLCKCGANINAIDEHGETAILIAVWHGFPKIVHILGEIGADTNMMNKEEETALHVASARGHYECVRCLLDSGADANLPNKNSYTPLHLALKRQHSLVAILLLKAGADYELADDNGERAIHYAARFNLISIAQWLCQSNRCQVNVPNKHGLYPLHIAAKSGHIEIVRTLCLAGSVVDQKDQDSIIPQICAIAQSHNDVADLLTRLRNERQKEEFIGQLMPINDQRLNRIKLKIFGHCGSGKSTLIESMKCGYFSSWFRRSKTTTNSTFLRKPFAAANGSSIIDPISARNISLNNINNKNVDRNQNPMIQNGQSCQNLSALSKTSTNLKTSSNTTNANFSSPTTTMSFKTTEPSIHGPVSIRQSQTKGIDCQQAYISNVGDLSIWEFSGHPCYHQIYDHFIGDSHCLHAIVFRLCDPVQIQLDGIFYWLYFIQSRTPIQEPLLFCGKSQQPAKVILIATHADIAQQFRTTDEIQNDLRLVMNKVDSVFKNVFDLHGQIFMIDANNAGSIEMKQLKQYLSQAKQTIVQDLPPTTGFLDSVLTFLNLFRKVSPNFPVLSLNQFKDMIRSQINPLSSDDHFKELVQQLETMGEIIFLKQTILTDCDLLVLNPKWLNCDIVGTLMMMKEDPNYLINLSKTRIMGIYSIDEFQEKFPDVDALDLLQLLESLSICAQNDRSGDIEYEFPYFNFSGDLEEILDQFQFKDNCSYHGIVYHCDRSLDRFYGSLLTCLFTRIQTNLSNELRKHPTFNVYDLHNCLKFSYFSHDDGRLMAIFSYNSSAQSIEIRFCGPIENRSDCFFFMQEMTNIVEQTLAKCMPGLTILKSYLSPSQLKTQRKNLSLYSSSALMRTLLMSSASNSKNIANSLLKKKVASDDGLIEERIGDIICFGILNLTEINQTSGEPTLANELHSSNLSLLTKQKLCSLLDPPESIGRDWCMFGILLGMTDKLPKLDPGANAQLSPTARVIEECVRNVNCTIKNLVEKLTELNRFDCVNVILQTGPLLRMFPLSSLPEEGIIYNDESSHTSLGVSTLSQTSSSNLSH
ncbi:ankyrin repeat domain containing protein 9 [Sarcoptes scabiei]|uniref:Ankyrin repeat domain containing protein 9 n=1 Tax=Sarcoptes scabiei TaxID=52283 RepID=A0A131ZXP2_SARSC|nr:ankyrin repeat domain containing protein 9 [Sarcoptes scabiei]